MNNKMGLQLEPAFFLATANAEMALWHREIVGARSLRRNEDVVRRAMIKYISGKINDSAGRVEAPRSTV